MNNYDVTKRDQLEQEILGSIMNYSEKDASISWVKDLILNKHGVDSPEYFYSFMNQSVFEAILKCWEHNLPATATMVMVHRPDAYKDRNDFDNYKGFDIAVLTMQMKFISQAVFHNYLLMHKQYILMDYWNLKANEIRSNDWEVRDILVVSDNIMDGYKLLFEKLTKNIRKDTSVKEVKDRAREEYERAQSGIVSWVPTGVPEYDRVHKGWRKGEQTIIAGRPSMGKSAIMVASAKHGSFVEKKRGCLFSLEVSKQQIMNHIIAAETGLSYIDIKDYKLSPENFEIILQWYDYFENQSLLKIYDINDARTVQEIYDKIQQYQPEFAMIDYLQLVKLDKKFQKSGANREQEVSEISRSFKLMTTEFKIPLIIGSQLSRSVDSRPGFRPRLSDLRESGSIEQDADNVWFPFRQAYYDEIGSPHVTIPLYQKGNFDLNQAKGRDGGTGNFQFNLDLVTYKFHDGHLDAPPSPGFSVGNMNV